MTNSEPNPGDDSEALDQDNGFFAMIPGRGSLKWLPIKGCGSPEPPVGTGNRPTNNSSTESGVE